MVGGSSYISKLPLISRTTVTTAVKIGIKEKKLQ